MTSFGVRFGALVKRKRGAERLSQTALVEAAFEDGQYSKSALSALENGNVADPQQATVDALVVYLNLSPEELEACRAPPPPTLPAGLEGYAEQIGVPQAVMFQLAFQFGHDNPKAEVTEYKRFLEQKAEDYRALTAELATLKAADARLANSVAAAEDDIAAGRFDDAQAMLEDAKTLSRARADEAVTQLADIEARQGDIALLHRGDATAAAAHYTAASDLLLPLDRARALDRRNDYAVSLARHGQRYGGQGLPTAATLWRALADIVDPQAEGEQWAKAQNNLAIALWNQGARTDGTAGAALLAEAVEAFRAALTVRTREAHPVQWATTQNNLANALGAQGERTDGAAGAALLAEAVEAYRAALTVQTSEAHPVDWAMTQNNLAAALYTQGERTDGAAGAALLAEAVEAYRAALTVRTREAHPVDWAMTQNNLAAALYTQGERT
ncbi:MAG: helix-turn-helix domain-containing protein, partial [Pseudomonadota bacterium]